MLFRSDFRARGVPAGAEVERFDRPRVFPYKRRNFIRSGAPVNDERDAGRGDSGDAAALLRAVRGRIARLAGSFARSAAEAEDLEQEMSLAIVRDFESYRGKGNPRAWAGRVALNVCRMYARRRKIENSVSEDLRKQGLPVAGEHLGDDASESSEAVEAALSRLEPRQAEVIRMRCLASMSYAEIGEALELSPGAVRAAVFRARRRLAGLLKPYLEGR